MVCPWRHNGNQIKRFPPVPSPYLPRYADRQRYDFAANADLAGRVLSRVAAAVAQLIHRNARVATSGNCE